MNMTNQKNFQVYQVGDNIIIACYFGHTEYAFNINLYRSVWLEDTQKYERYKLKITFIELNDKLHYLKKQIISKYKMMYFNTKIQTMRIYAHTVK